MKDFRCKSCRQLQFKWQLKDGIIEIEVKCYACNTFNTFMINLTSLISNTKQDLRENEKNSSELSVAERSKHIIKHNG